MACGDNACLVATGISRRVVRAIPRWSPEIAAAEDEKQEAGGIVGKGIVGKGIVGRGIVGKGMVGRGGHDHNFVRCLHDCVSIR